MKKWIIIFGLVFGFGFVDPASAATWTRGNVVLTADEIRIFVKDKEFVVPESASVNSDPGSDKYTTLEIIWPVENLEMRLFIYFKVENGVWKAFETRTYDGEARGEWIYFPGFEGNNVGKMLDKPELVLEDGRGNKVVFKNIKLLPFPIKTYQKSPAGYSLEIPVGQDGIVLTNEQNSGYGVSAILRDKNDNFVTNQLNIIYEWAIEDATIASVNSDRTCMFDMVQPCSNVRADLKGFRNGETKLIVKSLNVVSGKATELARTEVPIRVIGVISPSEENNQTKELQDLKNEVREIKQEQSEIRKILDQIFEWLGRLFNR